MAAGWDEAKTEQLRALWEYECDGYHHSAEAIGRKMGMTKNMIIGKANRLKLQARRRGAGMDETWITRDGRSVAVKDMSGAHVRSALRMLLRARRLAKAGAAGCGAEAEAEAEAEADLHPSGCDEHGSVA